MTIKFRAWDAKNKKMYYPQNIFEADLWFEQQKDGSLALCEIEDSFGSRNYLVLQQWTGLVDINKKEVFEGDIVKTAKGSIASILMDLNYTAGEIVWICEGFKVCQSGIGASWLGDFSHCDCCPADLEVIGNVFETPELK